MKLIFLLSLVSVLWISAPPAQSLACSCAMPGTVEESVEQSDEVFRGRVSEIVERDDLWGTATRMVLLDVSEVWKGGPGDKRLVFTGSYEASCGYPFVRGEEYVVYAHLSDRYDEDAQLSTSICTRTVPLDQASADLRELGEGKEPTREQAYVLWESKTSPWEWIIGLIVIGGAVFLMWRGKKIT